MPAVDPSALLDQLRAAPAESEVLEFKEAKQQIGTKELGEYFSALSNEANLHGKPAAWIVLGVQDKTHAIVGTRYREDPKSLQNLKQEIAQHTTNGLTFREIHEVIRPEGRVLLLEVPPAPAGVPTPWQGHYYARNNSRITGLNLAKIEEIRRQTATSDWSAEVCPDASLADLDPVAVAKAREQFVLHGASRIDAADIAAWSNEVLLTKARLLVEGRPTRAALILLGRSEAARHLSPAVAQITWKLTGAEEAYEHFAPPFLLATTRVWQRIRNFRFKLLPANQLVPVELEKYDQKIVLEALHNCIAHQDYRQCARIVVTEHTDRLVFDNAGDFFEGAVEDYVLRERTPQRYRNRCLADAMVCFGMIDTVGHGVRSMFLGQARRFFPLPDYDLSEPGQVRVALHGQLLDENYSRLLLEKTDLTLGEILALDRVQKHLPLSSEDLAILRRAGLVEGRRPHLRVAAAIAAATGEKVAYLKRRGFDAVFYRQRILDLVALGPTTRSEIDDLILKHLPDSLTVQQRATRVHHLLSALRDEGLIRNTGSRRFPQWVLVSPKETADLPDKTPKEIT